MVRGRGRGGRYFYVSRKFGVASVKKLARKVSSNTVSFQSGLWTIPIAPSRVSRMRTILRRCSKIFCVASHTVGYNKLCGIYLIFCLDLNYIMGSQRQWTVFELLDLLSAVNMQLYVCGFLAISGAQLKIKLHAHAPVHQHGL